ncbi:hypothetical protein ILP92_00345 [Maribius pontilimi]|uniref:Uncharacterized protein n=1 Tax=Palleronia pontilimi TaxID=1964209 RepID=A0A934I682_9RHOB|nr:hypothetical protein [Palleronia pontilimi]MBJ3761199.1 hypothetical protein [Palleronia pontilimi]
MRHALLIPLAVAACDQAPAPPTHVDLPLLGGYRSDADPCQRVGENAYTVDFLDDASDLVACPATVEDLGVFITETGAREVSRVGGFILYSVPTR